MPSLSPVAHHNADPDEGWSLPAWVYHDPEFFRIETARVMRPSWQVVCHVSDVPGVGDWHTLDFLGENIIVIRGEDTKVRAFTNVCRHRGSRLVDGSSGCAKKLICPYHAWTYELDGRLSGVPGKREYPTLDMDKSGLAAVESEIWRGFVFVRLEGGGPSVASMMAPYEEMIAPYRFEDLRAVGRVTMRPRTVNWKNVADNYSDGLHIPVAHPGLTRLFGKGYGIEAEEHVDRMWGGLIDKPSTNLSERMYQKILPRVDHLPDEAQRLWLYFKLWPNVAFDIYPDQVDFMQFIPVSPTETMIREISYALPDAETPEKWRREMKAARYLNWRINRQVNLEDTELIQRVQDGMASSSFTVGPLGASEVCLRAFCRKMRGLIPESRLHHAPAPGWSHRSSVSAVS
ncbi:aromatic ring-hydroxylating oxygenase subunit alpha [Sphingobium boeckii]|uniref:Phenylpropionate dioxygenase-like ring-hydroxylating dioxygenase large terminal subunit n=1 Tax=Sphingobium boeckii TaxID=1082345 RepID=A0A7W9AF08_9SPHN|nr:aromatic ring-hydroxylating dioxygenase subunit alpha [Sphingobium boeckii]MBB5684405.1 phenylpropionate dioxygenase-like ring-hydroxylating dioxygenase large terminal subunit [Sphingobium boeckii]